MPRNKTAVLRYAIGFILLFTGLPAVSSAQPKVLVELFQNIDCGPCGIADPQYQTYLVSHPGVEVVNYHNTTGDPNDIFYTQSFPASKDRDYLYGGGGPQNDPSASIDGFVAGSTEGNWQNITTQDLNSHPLPPITSSVSHGPNGIDTIFFSVTGTSNTQVKYYVAIKESKIYYANSERYGNPPDSLWNDVFRTMLPTQMGSSPVSFNGTLNTSVVFDPNKLPYSVNEQNMTAVIFVQDASASSGSNYQVEALGEISLAPPSAVAESASPPDQLIVPENPIPPQGHLAFELASSRNVQLTLFDLLGRQVRTLVDGRMPSGETSVELSGSGLAAGCYIARLSVDGRDAGHAMLVIEQ